MWLLADFATRTQKIPSMYWIETVITISGQQSVELKRGTSTLIRVYSVRHVIYFCERYFANDTIF